MKNAKSMSLITSHQHIHRPALVCTYYKERIYLKMFCFPSLERIVAKVGHLIITITTKTTSILTNLLHNRQILLFRHRGRAYFLFSLNYSCCISASYYYVPIQISQCTTETKKNFPKFLRISIEKQSK